LNENEVVVVVIVLAKFGRSIDIIFSMLCDNVINDIIDIDPIIFGSM